MAPKLTSDILKSRTRAELNRYIVNSDYTNICSLLSQFLRDPKWTEQVLVLRYLSCHAEGANFFFEANGSGWVFVEEGE